MNLNKLSLIGRVGKDPEVRNIEGGNKVANFSLATSEKYKDKEQTEWHNIVLWKGLAEVAEKYIHKGDLLYIEGKIRTRDWTDKDGNKRYITEVIGSELIMLSGKREAEPPAGIYEKSGKYDTPPAKIEEQEDDSLPF